MRRSPEATEPGWPEGARDAGPRDIEVSVVIPSYNSRRTVRACLASVLAQDTAARYEVVVVDSSDDGTEEIIREYVPRVRMLHFGERVSCGAARNVGIRHARGEYVLLVDTDCVVPPDWIERAVGTLRAHQADGICGSIRNGTPWSLSGTTGYFLEFFRFLGPRGPSGRVRFLVGGNSGYRRSVFRDAGFPDCSAGDDFEFSWELSRAGAVLVFDPAIAITHHNKTGVGRVLRYQYALGRAAGRYRRKTSPGVVRRLALFPPLVLLLPPVVLLWVACHVAVRCRAPDALRFLVAVPAMLLAAWVWALGLLVELRSPTPHPAAAGGGRHPEGGADRSPPEPGAEEAGGVLGRA